jgi:hypothetical protein
MKARLQEEGLGAAQEIDDLRTIVIYDDFDNPIMAVQKFEQGKIVVTKASEPDFQKVMSALCIGLNATYKRVGG